MPEVLRALSIAVSSYLLFAESPKDALDKFVKSLEESFAYKKILFENK